MKIRKRTKSYQKQPTQLNDRENAGMRRGKAGKGEKRRERAKNVKRAKIAGKGEENAGKANKT